METKKILVVDDEEILCEVLKLNLENEGYDVDIALNAEEALTLDLTKYNLILLDIMMGEISGTKFAGIIRKNPLTSEIPIIFCTAKDSEDDMITGLDLGADDYITKPYSIKNVIARVKTVLRRSSSGKIKAKEPEQIIIDGLVIDKLLMQCTIDGQEVKLAKKEFEILAFLATHAGRIYTREEILEKVWKGESIVLDRTIDVNITRLRQKIGKYGKLIITRSGYGYGFNL